MGHQMRLLSVSAENYRTLQKIDIRFSRDYCTISGKNNAGKSSVIRLLSTLFGNTEPIPWERSSYALEYKDDVTQWNTGESIRVSYSLELTKDDDPALISFIEKMADVASPDPTVRLDLQYILPDSDELKVSATFANQPVEQKAAKEINKKIRDSNLLFLYNSTLPVEPVYMFGARRRRFYDFMMSHDEEKELEEAGKSVDRKLRRIAKQHTQGLNEMLGKLSDRFDVEFSTPGKFSTRHTALGINLRDKHVELPLNDWGSGTQNRTQILMSILQANRIKTTYSLDDKITPIVVVEEPECFLHPSAQSEFGRFLATLSSELGVQIIVTTHSPYMLNREDPGSNILLCRESKKGTKSATRLVDTSGNGWMAPFAEHLGINSSEFVNWRPFFSTHEEKALLVEGQLDQEYFETLQQRNFPIECLNKDIKVTPYGGKDTLKNTLLVKFVLSQFDKVFITYDQDADADVKAALTRLGLKQNDDYLALGKPQHGKDCIEGLLPQRILSAVMGRETDLVMKLGSKERREAKEQLKRLLLAEFKRNDDYTKEELQDLAKAVKTINRKFAKP
jgi:putative ATP-dependent endonuclease of the OLD family